MSRYRILLSAYQCGPGMGSVSQIGWEWYSRLATRAEVTLITHVRNRAALERAGAPLAGSEVIYIDTEWFAGPLYRLAGFIFRRSESPVFLVSSLDYFVYDHAALGILKRRLAAGERWDLVHQVTPVSPLASTRLFKLGMPLVLGPWNGGLRSPDKFPEIMRAESGWLYPIRRLARTVDILLGATRNARLILTATRATVEALPAGCRDKSVFMLENGVDLEIFRSSPWPAPPSSSQPLKILFVGRLLPVKGVSMLLDAVASDRTRAPVRLTIVGAGPEEAVLRRQAETLGLQEIVRFAGGLPLPEVAGELAKAHVFCLPSVRESGGAVLLEAMAAARPVIALDYGGPSEIVDDQVGLLIPAEGRNAVVARLSSALLDVVDHPETWRRRGEAGRERVERWYSWNAKIDAAIDLYRDCLSHPFKRSSKLP